MESNSRIHPMAYTFIIDKPIDKRYSQVATHFWHDLAFMKHHKQSTFVFASYFKHGTVLEWSDALYPVGLTDWEQRDRGTRTHSANWKGGTQ